MAEVGDPCTWARDFWDLPLTSLPFLGRHRLGLHLNPVSASSSCDDGLPADWQGLAAKAGFNNLEIRNFRRDSNPTEAVLSAWEPQEGSTIGALLQHVMSLERWDILGDEHFQTAVRACRAETAAVNAGRTRLLLQNAAHRVTHPTLNTDPVDDLPHCDAMIVHAYEDTEFVCQFLEKIEHAAHMRFFIKFRDMLVGGVRCGDLARIIKNKCRWVLLLLTPAFLEDEECQFCLNVAHAFSPGLRKKLLLPVILQDCQLPDILSYVAFVDLTKDNIRDWQFKMMLRTLDQPPTGVSQQDLDTSDLHSIMEDMRAWLTTHPSSSSPERIILPSSSSPEQINVPSSSSPERISVPSSSRAALTTSQSHPSPTLYSQSRTVSLPISKSLPIKLDASRIKSSFSKCLPFKFRKNKRKTVSVWEEQESSA